MGTLSAGELARRIDHTLLKADATEVEIRRICAEAVENGFYSVCVNGRWLPVVAKALKGSNTVPIAVVGFPLGAMPTLAKAFETADAVGLGAMEIDMVIDVGGVKSGLWDDVAADIKSVVSSAAGKPVKVILETCYLSDEEIRGACHAAQRAGAKFVKTSTGFGTAGATAHHIKLMRETVGSALKVKASGGIRDLATAMAMIDAGADRLGCSASVAIVKAAAGEKGTTSGGSGGY